MNKFDFDFDRLLDFDFDFDTHTLDFALNFLHSRTMIESEQ